MLKFIKRLFCRHQTGRILEISYDGETVYECNNCGKTIRIPL